jgi:4-nitrophenyl phosphatase/NagD protein
MNDKNISNIFELTAKQVFFFDLDGTVYLGNRLLKGIHEIIEVLRINHKKFFFLSNNSSKSTEDYLKKLNKFNLNITRDNLILSQHPTIDYLKKKNFKKIFLLGTQSLKREFENEGFDLSEEEPEILVLAFDQELSYARLVKASYLLQKKNFPYIATHLDNKCPTELGYIPDAGGIAALLKKATERMPEVFGKPNKEMLIFKLNQLKISPNDAVIFGDRLYTDIRMGIEAGITTCCVLSGEATLESIKISEYKPDFIINGVWELLDAFNKK